MRPSWPSHFMSIARLCAEMSTCGRRNVGSVITDERGIILATGFNGVGPKQEHCTDNPCPGLGAPSGTMLDACEATHAEANALLNCPRLDLAHTIYTTTSPCVQCVKLLLSTNISQIVFCEEYPHPEASERWTRIPLLKMGRVTVAEPRVWSQLQGDGTLQILRTSGGIG